QRGLFGAVRFSLALGSACASPQGLPASYRNAAEMLSERLIEGTERLLEGEAAPSGLLSMDFQTRYAQEIAHAIEMLSVSEADQAADALSEAASTPGARGWELLELIRGAGKLFIMRLGSENAEQEAKAFADRCERCGSLRALTQGLKDLQREQLSRAAQQRRDRDAQPIRDAKLYIRKHFASPITLEEVSAAIGFSVNYFSTLFKKETGEGFAKYLTRVRMEAARGMLRDTRDPIAEICRQVGYGDIKHFTRTFKAETGVTPGEYRKLYG
ncbi:MAG: AraC family transcriptional regulator, partial [Clostridia bacterium]|nr:AraC family transcriptional regulator [Clostridia bacterium]